MKKLITILFFVVCTSAPWAADDARGVRFEEADTNGDGIIQVNEVQGMIDGFFIGTHDHGVMYVHSLIDHFFEQEKYQ